MNARAGTSACWAVSGLLLTAPLLVPYSASGPLSRTDSLSAVRVLGSPALAGSLPQGASYLLLAMPLAGLSLVATAGWTVAKSVRAAALAFSAAAATALVVALGLEDPRSWGAALWLGLAGLLLGVVTLIAPAVRSSLLERNPS